MSTTVISTSGPGKTPVWAETMRRWTDYFVKDFGGGPRPWKFAWVINFQRIFKNTAYSACDNTPHDVTRRKLCDLGSKC